MKKEWSWKDSPLGKLVTKPCGCFADFLDDGCIFIFPCAKHEKEGFDLSVKEIQEHA